MASPLCSPGVYTQADPEVVVYLECLCVEHLYFQRDDDVGSFVSPPPISYKPSYLDSPEFQFETSSEEEEVLMHKCGNRHEDSHDVTIAMCDGD